MGQQRKANRSMHDIQPTTGQHAPREESRRTSHAQANEKKQKCSISHKTHEQLDYITIRTDERNPSSTLKVM